MRNEIGCGWSLASLAVWAVVAGPLFGDETAVGPATEKRFPPLALPAGFQATLFACDPLIEYPSVIALGPRPGTLFVAHDYMTGLGTEIVRRDEIRLVEDADGDGYADRSTLFAGDFNSLQGMAYHAGTLYAMHAPLLTALRDADGDGVADERRDLLTGLGLRPEDNPTRLHCANGVAASHDGWLYLAMGDNGTDVLRPEGDRLVLQGGGIVRCRPDGRDLHVFATGLRNIYDLALDEELNVFVRDNENDGGDYMIRVCHSFHGADHGYPYLYYERPHEAMPPLADLGRGSSAGVACYLETAFPPEFHGNLFCCEWGRSVVRYERQRARSSFAAMKEIEFAAAAANDPYGLKPTDVLVDRDGSLLVSDWGDGQRPKRGRGRIYRIAHSGAERAKESHLPEEPRDLNDWVAQLDAPSYAARTEAQQWLQAAGDEGLRAVKQALNDRKLEALGRLHAVSLLAHARGREAAPDLFAIAENDDDARVRAQAVRALADLLDPIFTQQRLDSGRGDPEAAARLARLAQGQDPRIMLEVVTALGRLRWEQAPEWLDKNLNNPDAALAHAAMQTLRRSDNWVAAIALLDIPDHRPIRPIALRAIADRAEALIVDALMERLDREELPDRRRDYADLLTRVYKLPGPWTYWGYRPGPRPANSVAWERSGAIENALNRALGDRELSVRVAILRRMQREQIPVRTAALAGWLAEDRDADRVAAILDSLAKSPGDEARELLAAVVETPEHAEANRRRALSLFLEGASVSQEGRLLEIARRVEDGPVLVAVIGELGARPKLDSGPIVLSALHSEQAAVRAAALAACTKLQIQEAAGSIPAALGDSDPQVRIAAATAAGELDVKEAVELLLIMDSDQEPEIRSASLAALRRLHQPRAVGAALAALEHAASELAAIEYLAEFGGPEHAGAVAAAASRSRSIEILLSAARALAKWDADENPGSSSSRALDAAMAEIHGQCGVLLRWKAVGPVAPDVAGSLDKQTPPLDARSLVGAGAEARIEMPRAEDGSNVALAFAEISLAEPTRAQFLASSNGTLEVWLNGASIYRREQPGAFQPDADRFEAELNKGTNRIAVQLHAVPEGTQFHLRFRAVSSSAEHERLTQYALENVGDAARGREVFFNAEKSLCLKCHQLESEGGQVGPHLTGVGDRFSRIHLIESILTPSRAIAPSYETIFVVLTSGVVVTGVKISEDETTLALGDEKGERHTIAKSLIEERVIQPKSTMPEGLEKRLTDREFLDLLAFLQAQKRTNGSR
jgi:putative membrane-bound dehydrogenase-like protein